MKTHWHLRSVVSVVCDVFSASSPAYVFLFNVFHRIHQEFHARSKQTFRLVHINDRKSEKTKTDQQRRPE